MSREAMQLALGALELYQSRMSVQMFDEAVKALRKALETEQEPVAWLDPEENISDEAFTWSQSKHHTVPLYTAPPAREWVGLTDEEIMEMLDYGQYGRVPQYARNFVDAIEAKLKEKNT